jgi:BASS family bile acid:Na+ symporter
VVFLAVGLAIGLRFSPRLRGYQFTAWIIAAVTAAMIFPGAFKQWYGVNLRQKWLILLVVQTVMFGMGTQMSLKDFAGIAKSPRGVVVGIVPFCRDAAGRVGLTKVFHFEPEIAAGIILIGSCSSGLASNVMAYIARSNLALSVTVTAITTMVAPIMTPFLMTRLAGTLVEVKFFNMMMEIIKMVIVPIGAALHDHLKPRAEGSSGLCAAAAYPLAWQAAGESWNPSERRGAGGDGCSVLPRRRVVVGVAYQVHTLVAPAGCVDAVASMAGIVCYDRLAARGVTTCSRSAFCCSWRPRCTMPRASSATG